MSLIHPSNPVFKALGSILGILDGQAVTAFDPELPVVAMYDIKLAVEAGVAEYRSFGSIQADVGSGTVTVDVDVRRAADWNVIILNSLESGLPVPVTHDAWIIRVGLASAATASNLTSSTVFYDIAATVGLLRTPLAFFDTDVGNNTFVKGAGLDPPFLSPLPWYTAPDQKSDDQRMRWQRVVGGAVTTTLTFDVISAPPGAISALAGS